MADAFDQWVEWRCKPPRSRRSIPADLYAAVMSLPETSAPIGKGSTKPCASTMKLAGKAEPYGST